VLACFGLSPEADPYHIDVPDWVYTAGRVIAADLQEHEEEAYRQLSWLMRWITSSSNNTSIDLDHSELCEFTPLSWEPDDLAFALEIIREADQVMADALAGLAFINRQPAVLAALQHNIKRIYQAIQKQKGKHHEPRLRLAWPHLTDGPQRTAESVA